MSPADLLPMLDNRGIVMSAIDVLLYPSFILGAHGAIAAILTTTPVQCVALWDAIQAGRHEEALTLHSGLLRLWNAIQADWLPPNVKFCQSLQSRSAGKPGAPMPETSFDNVKFTNFLSTPLTTVAAPIEEAGSTAARSLIRLVRGQEVRRLDSPNCN